MDPFFWFKWSFYDYDDKEDAQETYSKFVTKMHGKGLAVHPYTLKNDKLLCRETIWEEHKLYVE